jgi:hypothetical protein
MSEPTQIDLSAGLIPNQEPANGTSQPVDLSAGLVPNAPNSGLAPAAGGPASQPMQKSNLGIALGSENEGIANPQQPAEQFALQNPDQQGKLAGAAAVGASGALVGYAPEIAAAVVRHIYEPGAILKFPFGRAVEYYMFGKLGLSKGAIGQIASHIPVK